MCDSLHGNWTPPSSCLHGDVLFFIMLGSIYPKKCILDSPHGGNAQTAFFSHTKGHLEVAPETTRESIPQWPAVARGQDPPCSGSRRYVKNHRMSQCQRFEVYELGLFLEMPREPYEFEVARIQWR